MDAHVWHGLCNLSLSDRARGNAWRENKMKTMAISMAVRKRNGPSANEQAGFPGFADYVCRNGTCVLSRFDRFSMAATSDARCPVCGEVASLAADETPSN